MKWVILKTEENGRFHWIERVKKEKTCSIGSAGPPTSTEIEEERESREGEIEVINLKKPTN